MPEPGSADPTPRMWRPHDFDHRHGDVSGGWLRAATFGAMDGLVCTANEQIDAEVRVESRAFRRHPGAERAELTDMLVTMVMTPETAAAATTEIHRDENLAVNFHLVQELGVDPREKPSPSVAARSSFFLFALGAVVPLIPYLLGFESLWAGLALGGAGLLLVGAGADRFTGRGVVFASTRQLLLGAVAIAATYAVGSLVGTVV